MLPTARAARAATRATFLSRCTFAYVSTRTRRRRPRVRAPGARLRYGPPWRAEGPRLPRPLRAHGLRRGPVGPRGAARLWDSRCPTGGQRPEGPAARGGLLRSSLRRRRGDETPVAWSG